MKILERYMNFYQNEIESMTVLIQKGFYPIKDKSSE